MHLMFRGKVWRLEWFPKSRLRAKTKGGPAYGLCDAPSVKGKKILVFNDMTPEKELEVLLHEGLHACSWDMAEEAVEETARDLRKMLWRLGWRCER